METDFDLDFTKSTAATLLLSSTQHHKAESRSLWDWGAVLLPALGVISPPQFIALIMRVAQESQIISSTASDNPNKELVRAMCYAVNCSDLVLHKVELFSTLPAVPERVWSQPESKVGLCSWMHWFNSCYAYSTQGCFSGSASTSVFLGIVLCIRWNPKNLKWKQRIPSTENNLSRQYIGR